jgi:hypothetical protein
MHLDLVTLADGCSEDQRQQLLGAARVLAEMDCVVRAGVIEAEHGSDFDLAFFYVLPEFSALEPFGTHELYSRFLQRYLAPVLRQLAGADVKLAEGSFPESAQASCLALAAEEETYDWEVNEALTSWAAGQGVVGLATGERQQYRGVALVVGKGSARQPAAEDSRFRAQMISGPLRRLR